MWMRISSVFIFVILGEFDQTGMLAARAFDPAASHRKQQDTNCADREGERRRKDQCFIPAVPHYVAHRGAW